MSKISNMAKITGCSTIKYVKITSKHKILSFNFVRFHFILSDFVHYQYHIYLAWTGLGISFKKLLSGECLRRFISQKIFFFRCKTMQASGRHPYQVVLDCLAAKHFPSLVVDGVFVVFCNVGMTTTFLIVVWNLELSRC